MRQHELLAPQRQPQPVGPKRHEGTIVAERTNPMWGIDATAGFTVRDGRVAIFARIDHCSACCLGIHVARRGTRLEALEPVRHDHGSQFMSGDFQRGIRFLGLESSPAFVREPEGNGPIERFFRTLKEQLLWVRHFETLEELAEALERFRQRYNEQWLVERLRFQSPRQAHQALLALAACCTTIILRAVHENRGRYSHCSGRLIAAPAPVQRTTFFKCFAHASAVD